MIYLQSLVPTSTFAIRLSYSRYGWYPIYSHHYWSSI